ncbi:MAG: hypothetical protein U5O39_18590 [Gammaproteobacteria bacterium]|nr:hypothetical protein [Gammaproteobacteria bacterium]
MADVERAGGQPSQSSIDRIESIDERIDQIASEIEAKRKEKAALRASFAADLERVRELYRDHDEQQSVGES